MVWILVNKLIPSSLVFLISYATVLASIYKWREKSGF